MSRVSHCFSRGVEGLIALINFFLSGGGMEEI